MRSTRSRLAVATTMLGCLITTVAPIRGSAEIPTGRLQQTLAVPGAPMSGAVDPETYHLGPGDVLTLYLFGRISQTSPLLVGPDGTIFLSELGSMAVAGRTLGEVQRDLAQRISRAFRDVRTEVRLEHVRTMLIYLTGDVRSPGPVPALGSSRVADLLPDSLFNEGASRRNIIVRHRDGTETVYDLQRFELTGRDPMRGTLDDGDVIYVPPAHDEVGAWGGVARPGRYQLGVDDSLSTLLALVGGLIPAAMSDRSLLVRANGTARESLTVRPYEVMQGVGDLPLRAGDQLFVDVDPEHLELHQVTVLGLVERAGHHPITPGRTRLSDVMRAAGGFRDGADRAAIRLVRHGPDPVGEGIEFERLSRLGRREMTNSEYEVFRSRLAAQDPDTRIDWARIHPGDPESDPLLLDGDVIEVDRMQNSVRVDGQVVRPGIYPFQPDRSWRYYVELAGGFASRGARSKVLVTRSVNGQSINAKNVGIVLPGDFVWVPERPDVTTWDHLKEVLSVGAGIATIAIAFRR